MTNEDRLAEIARYRGLMDALESGELQTDSDEGNRARINDLKRKIAIHETLLGLNRA